MNRCLNCNEIVENNANNTRLYCSDKCRKAHKRVHLGQIISDKFISDKRIIHLGQTNKLPDNYGTSDCQCQSCEQNHINKDRYVINHGDYKDYSQLGDNEINRVALPGDVDYAVYSKSPDSISSKMYDQSGCTITDDVQNEQFIATL
jgi:endogenous inhibitor of DNA gyrase (YacG/DUF329 family)